MELLFSEPTKKFQKKSLLRELFSLSGFLLLLVHVYRAFLGGHLGGNCRFHPSCSQYAVQVLRTHPPLSALLLIFRRILRCRPFGEMGYDPAPHPVRGNYERKT